MLRAAGRMVNKHLHMYILMILLGITADLNTRRIYYIDAKSDAIYSVDYQGTDNRLILKDATTISHPFSITVYENHVYWSDWVVQLIVRVRHFIFYTQIDFINLGKQIQWNRSRSRSLVFITTVRCEGIITAIRLNLLHHLHRFYIHHDNHALYDIRVLIKMANAVIFV
jgi:hypothetical protein